MDPLFFIIPAAFVAYWTVAIILLYHPTLIRNRRPSRPFRLSRGAHRGGGGERPENTISAFYNAVRHGCDFFELDVMLTADGEVVVFHDDSLLDLTGVHGKVQDFNYADLPPIYRCPILPPPFHSAFNKKCVADWDADPENALANDTRIPRLRDIFRLFPNTFIIIELKQTSTELAQKISALVEEFDRYENTCWGLFEGFFVPELRRINPNIMLYVSYHKAAEIFLRFLLGLLPYYSIEEDIYLGPLFTDEEMEEYERRYAAGGPNWGFITWFRLKLAKWIISRPSLYHHLRERGIHVAIYCATTPALVEEMQTICKEGVLSDFPSYFPASTVPCIAKDQSLPVQLVTSPSAASTLAMASERSWSSSSMLVSRSGSESSGLADCSREVMLSSPAISINIGADSKPQSSSLLSPVPCRVESDDSSLSATPSSTGRLITTPARSLSIAQICEQYAELDTHHQPGMQSTQLTASVV